MSAPSVRLKWVGLGTTDGLDDKTYIPPTGWFVDDVLPVAASNGLGVIIVLRALNPAAPSPSTPEDSEGRET